MFALIRQTPIELKHIRESLQKIDCRIQDIQGTINVRPNPHHNDAISEVNKSATIIIYND